MDKAEVTRVVHDAPQHYTIYETDYVHLGKWPHRHILDVNVHVGAAGFSMGLPLTFAESMKVDSGDWAYFAALADAVQDNPFRYASVQIDTSSLNGGKDRAG
jgi:hypothetical protein